MSWPSCRVACSANLPAYCVCRRTHAVLNEQLAVSNLRDGECCSPRWSRAAFASAVMHVSNALDPQALGNSVCPPLIVPCSAAAAFVCQCHGCLWLSECVSE